MHNRAVEHNVAAFSELSFAVRWQERLIEGKVYSRTDIISDHRLKRSKHGSNCARSSEQQDMLVLG